MDPATIMMLASLASSAAGAAGVGATEGGTGTIPYQWLQNPEYGGQSQKMATANDFYTNQIAGMNANGGQLPPALLKLLQQMQQGMSRQNHEAFYGTPGQRTGIMDTARSTGAALGTGPKATTAQVNKQLGNFQSAEKSIMEYISGLGVQQGASWMNSILGNANSAPQGPQGQWGGGQQYTIQGTNPLGDLGKAGMTAAPWASGLNTMSGLSSATPYFSVNDAAYAAQPGYADMMKTQGYSSPQKLAGGWNQLNSNATSNYVNTSMGRRPVTTSYQGAGASGSW